MDYFVIYGDEDGEMHIDLFSKDKLERALNNKDWGDDPKIFDKVPDFQHEAGLLIIRGDIAVPRPVKIVEKIEL